MLLQRDYSLMCILEALPPCEEPRELLRERDALRLIARYFCCSILFMTWKYWTMLSAYYCFTGGRHLQTWPYLTELLQKPQVYLIYEPVIIE